MPNNYTPKPHERWRYVGPGEGCTVWHTVLFIFADDTVATWSDSFRANGGGDSWFGPVSDFLKVFRPL